MLMPRPGTWATRIGHHFARSDPGVSALATIIGGYVVLAVTMVLVGILWTDVVVQGGPGEVDRDAARWFAHNRSDSWNEVTAFGSTMADTETVVAVAVLVGVVLVSWRRWGQLLVLVVPLTVEVTVFLSTTYLVDRDRPAVEALDAAPATASFPSGHAAAAVALYVGLAFVVASSRLRGGVLPVLAMVLAVLAALFVGVSRVYRGLHYPTDVMWGWALGAAAVCTGVLAARAAIAAALAARPTPPPLAAGRLDRSDKGPVR